MNSKFYISLEAARLLKEKGYNEEYINHYDENGEIIIPYYEHEYDKLYPAPTKAEAIDWLESKGVVVATSLTYNRKWFCTIESFVRGEIVSTLDLPTRLEAEDAAIIKALEIL